MRKTAFLFFLLIFSFPCFSARKAELSDTISVRRAFMELSSAEMDLLSKDRRFEMLIYFDNDSIHKAPNNLGGRSYIEQLTPGFISVKLSDSSSLQIEVLPTVSGSEIVMTVHTVGDDVRNADSEIAFYDSSLRPIATAKLFSTPSLTDFMNPSQKKRIKEAEMLLPFMNIVYESKADGTTLIARLSYKDIVSMEDARRLDELLIPTVSYIWNGKKYIKNK